MWGATAGCTQCQSAETAPKSLLSFPGTPEPSPSCRLRPPCSDQGQRLSGFKKTFRRYRVSCSKTFDREIICYCRDWSCVLQRLLMWRRISSRIERAYWTFQILMLPSQRSSMIVYSQTWTHKTGPAVIQNRYAICALPCDQLRSETFKPRFWRNVFIFFFLTNCHWPTLLDSSGTQLNI